MFYTECSAFPPIHHRRVAPSYSESIVWCSGSVSLRLRTAFRTQRRWLGMRNQLPSIGCQPKIRRPLKRSPAYRVPQTWPWYALVIHRCRPYKYCDLRCAMLETKRRNRNGDAGRCEHVWPGPLGRDCRYGSISRSNRWKWRDCPRWWRHCRLAPAACAADLSRRMSQRKRKNIQLGVILQVTLSRLYPSTNLHELWAQMLAFEVIHGSVRLEERERER